MHEYCGVVLERQSDLTLIVRSVNLRKDEQPYAIVLGVFYLLKHENVMILDIGCTYYIRCLCLYTAYLTLTLTSSNSNLNYCSRYTTPFWNSPDISWLEFGYCLIYGAIRSEGIC